MSTAAGAGALAQPWTMKIVVDQVLGGKRPGPALGRLLDALPGAGSPMALLAEAATASLVLFVLAGVLEYGMALGWLRVGQRMVYDLERDLFARLLKRSLAFHARASIGDSMSRVTTDSYCVYGLVDTLLITPAKSFLLAALTVAVMAGMNGPLTVIAVLAAPCMGAAVFLLGGRLERASRAKRDIESRIQAHVRQMLSGVQVVQAFAQERRESTRFQHQAAAAVRAYQRTVFLSNVADFWSGSIVALGTGLILFVGARLVLGGSLTVGELLVFVAYLAALQGYFQSLARSVTSLQSLRGEMDRVLEILDAEPEIRQAPSARRLAHVRGHLRLEHVSVAYPSAPPVLHDIDLELHEGETVAIVGKTGAGKTTLVSLLPRFIDPNAGRVLLDGYDLRTLSLADLRHNVAVVFQDPFLTPGTIAENIAFGAAEATRDRIVAAAVAANAHDFISALPEGYETVLGERGMTLSGGQRQRLAIARAFFKDANLLVLDEPTSALDAASERLIVDALRRLARGRTTLIVAHRLSTIRHADRIVVLGAGRIVEQGTHDELVAADGAYAAMHAVQAGTPAIGAES